MAGNKRWSDSDLKILQDEYGRTPLFDLAQKLGRSIDALQWKAAKEGISFVREITVEKYDSIEKMLKDIQTDIKLIKQKLNI